MIWDVSKLIWWQFKLHCLSYGNCLNIELEYTNLGFLSLKWLKIIFTYIFLIHDFFKNLGEPVYLSVLCFTLSFSLLLFWYLLTKCGIVLNINCLYYNFRILLHFYCPMSLAPLFSSLWLKMLTSHLATFNMYFNQPTMLTCNIFYLMNIFMLIE